ncbi:MAG: hypothetical protein Q8R50_00345, partial [Sediminibacterium sp.]|nr:hypothetical protein [Sediminibacterium sp.]
MTVQTPNPSLILPNPFLRIFATDMEQATDSLYDPVLPKYNLTEEQEKNEIIRHYRALLRGLRPKLKKGDKELIRQAFEMAAESHKTMRRKSGEPYIIHPLAVAMI